MKILQKSIRHIVLNRRCVQDEVNAFISVMHLLISTIDSYKQGGQRLSSLS